VYVGLSISFCNCRSNSRCIAVTSSGRCAARRRCSCNHLFGLRHFVLGIADYTGRSNLHDFIVETAVQPRNTLTAGLQIHFFRLDEDKDAWRAPNLSVVQRDVTGQADTELGSEIDLFATYKVKNFEFHTGLACFLSGEYVEDTTGRDKDAWWQYVQVLVKF